MSQLLAVTKANFESEVLNSELPVLIDFWAVWCGPCKMIAPIVEELATEYAGKIKVAKCDVDSEQALAIQYGIRSIPTILIFKQGEVVEQIVGAFPKPHLKNKIEKVLAK
ncbi:MAG: thioredoxin [candidate division KSB1 bacterium]|nr:thioredoxin [candidate division KSB1 bacterium]MDZ7317554.1 thioredoxin [candidate division KSB1 bacterium]MDZ7342041.1 thioredoxin [candidate division KSB1 bacterium]